MVLGKIDFVWLSTPFSIPQDDGSNMFYLVDQSQSLSWQNKNEGDYLHSVPEKGFLFPPLPEREQERMLCGHYTTLGSYLENQFEGKCQRMKQTCI